MLKNKLIIAGGSGFLGKILVKKFQDEYLQTIILTRGESKVKRNISYVHWDGKTLGDWTKELEGSDVIINLVGKSVNCRYTEKNKKEIIDSRVNATTIIGKAISQCSHPPQIWINAGSSAIFGNSGNEIKDEHSTISDGFSPEVCKKWEQAFNEAVVPRTRKVFLRIGLVLQKGDGLLKPFVRMVKLGVGGKFGPGEQYISWIHEEDFTNIVQWVIKEIAIQGIIHCTSPFPVTNGEFMKGLRTANHIPFGIPNPAFLIKAGAVFIGTEAELVLSGRRVVPKILSEKGFIFKYPLLKEALYELHSG